MPLLTSKVVVDSSSDFSTVVSDPLALNFTPVLRITDVHVAVISTMLAFKYCPLPSDTGTSVCYRILIGGPNYSHLNTNCTLFGRILPAPVLDSTGGFL
jgi:hypothetical protein